jgi:(S)-sulfolactate dehydrogenase
VLQDCKRLKVIACTEPGHQNIDMDACRKRGIEVIFAAEANAQAVSEYVLSAAFALRRKLFMNQGITQGVAAGEWVREPAMQGQELFGATLGLIGFQDIASQRIAYLAQALGMRVCGFDPGIAMDDPIWVKRMIKPQFMADLLRTADIVSLHLPRSVHTRRLIDGASFSIMKSSAILISANAGGVVNEQALAEALREGQIAGAALDVFDREPLPDTAAFKDCPNLLLSPHIAGQTQESAKRVSRLLVERVFKSLDLGSSSAVPSPAPSTASAAPSPSP